MLNVATIGPTGHPHLVAMWYAMLDGHPSFWTFGKSQKIVNLRRDPRITALVESGDAYSELRGVELVGTARIVEDFDAIVAIGRAVAAKYQGPEAASSPEVLAFLEGQARKRVGVVIDVDRVVSWDHTKLAGTLLAALVTLLVGGSTNNVTKALTHRADDVVGLTSHLVIRVFVNLAAHVLELVAPLRVPGSLGVGRVPLAPGDLDDDGRALRR